MIATRVGIAALAGLLAVAPLSSQSTVTAGDTLRDGFAEVNGVRLHYRIGGHGPVLVLLHGLTVSGVWWDALAPDLLADSTDDVNLPPAMLARVKSPTLIVFGDRDGHPVEIATELYRMLPRAQLWIVPNTGHSPVWSDWGGDRAAAAAFPGAVKSCFSAAPTTGGR